MPTRTGIPARERRSPGMWIRADPRAGRAAAAAIARIQVRAWQDGYRGIVSDAFLDGLSVGEVEEIWRGLLDPALDDPPFVVVALDERGHGRARAAPATVALTNCA